MVVCEQLIRWMGIEARVPRAWQVVRHGVSPRRGELTWVDRYRQRMTLSWTQCGDEPDLRQMVRDYRSKQLEVHGGALIEELPSVPGWLGLCRRFEGSGEHVTQAVRYDGVTGRLLEAAVTSVGDAGEAGALAAGVLSGTAVVEPAEAITRWRAFDLDVTLPGRGASGGGGGGAVAWRLGRAEVRPADVTLSFSEFAPGRWKRWLPTGGEVTVRRLGLADGWFDGDAAGVLRRCGLKGAAMQRMAEDGAEDGADDGDEDRAEDGDGGDSAGEAKQAGGVRWRGWEAGPGVKRVLGLLRRREDAAWWSERCNAVVHVSARWHEGRRRWGGGRVGWRGGVESVGVRCEASDG